MIAFVPLFSPAMWHKSRLLSSPDGIKTKHLKPQQRLYESWIDFSLQFSKTKQNFLFYETIVQVCEKIEIIKKSLLHIRSCILVVFRVTWFELNVKFLQFSSALLLSTCLFFSFFHFVFSILSNLIDFLLKREPKQTFYWY